MWVGRGISGHVWSRVCCSNKRNQGAEVIPFVGGDTRGIRRVVPTGCPAYTNGIKVADSFV